MDKVQLSIVNPRFKDNGIVLFNSVNYEKNRNQKSDSVISITGCTFENTIGIQIRRLAMINLKTTTFIGGNSILKRSLLDVFYIRKMSIEDYSRT